jgi:hypothetical protein
VREKRPKSKTAGKWTTREERPLTIVIYIVCVCSLQLPFRFHRACPRGPKVSSFVAHQRRPRQFPRLKDWKHRPRHICSCSRNLKGALRRQ